MPPCMDEIERSLFSMKREKFPGSIVLPPLFFQNLWHFLKLDVHAFVLSIFINILIPKGLNHTIITLVPKCDNPRTPDQFRPIRLCNVILKILTKPLPCALWHSILLLSLRIRLLAYQINLGWTILLSSTTFWIYLAVIRARRVYSWKKLIFGKLTTSWNGPSLKICFCYMASRITLWNLLGLARLQLLTL